MDLYLQTTLPLHHQILLVEVCLLGHAVFVLVCPDGNKKEKCNFILNDWKNSTKRNVIIKNKSI